jgi:hypothetical protein
MVASFIVCRDGYLRSQARLYPSGELAAGERIRMESMAAKAARQSEELPIETSFTFRMI